MDHTTSVTSEGLPERLGPKLFVTGLAILWAYLSAAFLFETTLGGLRIGMVALAGVFGVGMAVIAAVPRATLATRILPKATMFAIGLACMGLTLAMLGADFALAVRDNIVSSRSEEAIGVEGRTSDRRSGTASCIRVSMRRPSATSVCTSLMCV